MFELLLFIPFTNAKLEVMFSRMLHKKTDRRNQLNRQHLDALLCTGEEGQSIVEFDPNGAINLWFNNKLCHLIAISAISFCYISDVAYYFVKFFIIYY